ncbi:MAG: O-antigen ligase family protein [Pseudomonadales bacterium]
MDASIRAALAFYILFIVVFLAGVSTGQNSFDNSVLILRYEMFYVFCSILLVGFPSIADYFSRHRVTSILLVLFVLSIIASAIYSPYSVLDKKRGMERFLVTLGHLVFFVFVFDLFSRFKLPRGRIFWAVIAANLWIAVIFVFTWFSPLGKEWDWYGDPPFNAHIRLTGYQAATALAALGACYLVAVNSTFKHMGFGLLLLGSWLFVVWLDGRMAVIASLLVILALCVFMFLHKRLKLWHVMVILGTFSIAMFCYLQLEFNYKMEQRGNALTRFSRADPSASRFELWLFTLEAWKQEPWFGYGSQGFLYIPGKRRGPVQPHGMFFQFLIEWGLVGSLLFCGLVLRGLWAGFKAHCAKFAMSDYSVLVPLAVMVVLGVHGLTDGTFYHAQPSFYFVLALGVWAAGTPADEEDTKTSL